VPWLGGKGAAIATIICSALVFVQLAWATAMVLKKTRSRALIAELDRTEKTPVT
jgi:hypothetical protein